MRRFRQQRIRRDDRDLVVRPGRILLARNDRQLAIIGDEIKVLFDGLESLIASELDPPAEIGPAEIELIDRRQSPRIAVSGHFAQLAQSAEQAARFVSFLIEFRPRRERDEVAYGARVRGRPAEAELVQGKRNGLKVQLVHLIGGRRPRRVGCRTTAKQQELVGQRVHAALVDLTAPSLRGDQVREHVVE